MYLDGPNAQFDPTCIASQFLHVYIIIKQEVHQEVEGYRVIVTSSTDVPHFGPPLPTEGVFLHPSHLRHFILAKMINGENAAYKAPKFMKPQVRTRNAIMDDIISEFGKKSETVEEDYVSPTSSAGARRGSFFNSQALRKIITHTDDVEEEVGGSAIGGMLSKRLWNKKSSGNTSTEGVANSSAESVPDDKEDDDVLHVPAPQNAGRKKSIFAKR